MYEPRKLGRNSEIKKYKALLRYADNGAGSHKEVVKPIWAKSIVEAMTIANKKYGVKKGKSWVEIEECKSE